MWAPLYSPFWRRAFRACWILLALGWLVSLPWTIIEFKRQDYSVHYVAWFIAGIFVLLTLPVSFYEVAMHLEYYTRPKLQIRVIRILWMVPIYAVDSWFALRFKEAHIYLDAIRECYEAFVIYNFYMFLVAYLEEEYGDIGAYFSSKDDVQHMWGVQYVLKPWRMGDEFFWECKKGVLSYVIVRPLMTAVSLVASLVGVECEGEFRISCTYPYTSFFNNFTQIWALYCLVLMYMACHEELLPIRPLGKFIVVKAVVFLSFWQSVFIAGLVWLKIIKTSDWRTYDVYDVSAGLQEFLICIEMFVAALAHAYTFPPRDYFDPNHQPPHGFWRSVRIMFDVRDVADDVRAVLDDTVQQSTDRIAEGGQMAWTTARRTTKGIVEKPRALLRLFAGGRFSRKGRRGRSESGITEEAETALLSYSTSSNDSAPSSPGHPRASSTASLPPLAARVRRNEAGPGGASGTPRAGYESA